jgi:uncharacterized membrane protein
MATTVPAIRQRVRLSSNRFAAGHVLVAAAGLYAVFLILIAAFAIASGDAKEAAGAVLMIMAFLFCVAVVGTAFDPNKFSHE